MMDNRDPSPANPALPTASTQSISSTSHPGR